MGWHFFLSKGCFGPGGVSSSSLKSARSQGPVSIDDIQSLRHALASNHRHVTVLVLWTLVPSNIAGRTKKSATGVEMIVGYCDGQANGAQVFQAKDAPRFFLVFV